MLNNVYIHDCGANGFDVVGNCRYGLFFRCRSDSCDHGFYRPYGGALIACSAADNSSDGFEAYYDAVMIDCLAYDNGSANFRMMGDGNGVFQCSAEGGGYGIHSANDSNFAIGVRVTNASNDGIYSSYPLPLAIAYLENTDDLQGSLITRLEIDGNDYINATEADSDTADTDYGYIDSSADDYNLTSSATNRSVAITMD